jgi:predicted ArsR family transcriptional regulator
VGDRWNAVAALVDRSRRALYDYVRRQDHPVSREEAASARHMSRSLAAFHLDRLVQVGLLRARYEAQGRRPRGRGRAPKLYEPAGDGVIVSIPERRYELIAEILADAVVEDPTHAQQAALRISHRRGRDLGKQLRETGMELTAALADLGFEPHRQNGRVLLRNCPFHVLATRQSALVCTLNHAFLTGLVDGLDATEVQPRLAPRAGACCVEFAV